MNEKYDNETDLVEHVFDVMETLRYNDLLGIYEETVEVDGLRLELRIDYYGCDIQFERYFMNGYTCKMNTTVFSNEGVDSVKEEISEWMKEVKEEMEEVKAEMKAESKEVA